VSLGGCTGGAAGSPLDDIGDIVVFSHSPGHGDTLRTEDSVDGFNGLNNPTLTNPGAVTVVISNSLDLTSVINSNLFQTINSNLASGLGPVDITGDPVNVRGNVPCSPRFTTYFVANAGEGTARTSNYNGGVIGTTIPVPGVQLIASWWSR